MKYVFKNKFAVLSHILPPSPSGQSIVLYRLLSQISTKSYCLISREEYNKPQPISASKYLGAKYYHLKPFLFNKPFFIPSLFFKLLKMTYLLPLRVLQIRSIMKQEKCTVLLACTGDTYDMVTAYTIGILFKVPVIFYMFDDFAYQQHLLSYFVTKKIQSLFFRMAKAVIVPNEFLQKEYAKNYKINAIIIHNPLPPIPIKKTTRTRVSLTKRRLDICYTGAIYQAHFDSFINLLRAVKLLEKFKIKIHLYTFQTQSFLEKHGISSADVVFHPHVDQKNIQAVQKKADILFLPLAFSSPIQEIITTSSPGKMAEYLSIGKPILVHAPKDSFVSWYFKKYNCGIVVDKSDANLLAEAIIKLIQNSKLQKRIIANAQERARQDFSMEKAREKFISIVGQI